MSEKISKQSKKESKLAVERFLAFVKKRRFPQNEAANSLPDPCWYWTGYYDKTEGYGRFWDGKEAVWAHIWSYSHLRDTIPEKKHLDHLCRVRRCVNPNHLDPVELYVNLLRGDRTHLGEYNKKKTHCPAGHRYSEENTYINNNRRYCRTCNSDRSKRVRDMARQYERSLKQSKKKSKESLDSQES